MGLTKSSVGAGAIDTCFNIKKQNINEKIIALAGNPNVGKSTLFNGLTGLNQHTGNWAGKTVSNAIGYCKTSKNSYVLVDIPGTYSLAVNSAEEAVARDYICFGDADAVVVVCDATCLERNLNLALQIMETGKKTLVCINLMDEANRKGISIDLDLLSQKLGVPIIGVTARKKNSLNTFLKALDSLNYNNSINNAFIPRYSAVIENAINTVEAEVKHLVDPKINSRWVAIRLLEKSPELYKELESNLGKEVLNNPSLFLSLAIAEEELRNAGITKEKLCDEIAASLILSAEEICKDAITYKSRKYNQSDRKLDRLLTGKITAYPFMLILLGFIFWLTIIGANYPSAFLSYIFTLLGDKLNRLFSAVNMPDMLHSIILDGIYQVLSSVVAVMLPPMAIFFPLFTLLEDVGYLPRVAYNLDLPFKRCGACGKQALTICMAFGCNAAGIVGCRIIGSKRERLLAILTNNFIPCNGRFPILISIITMFFVVSTGTAASIISVLILIAAISVSIILTFAITKLLSKTVLKGVPSSFTLELPPYRKPQIGKILVHSVFDRTLFVLGRAVTAAIPAGIIIWLMANITLNGNSLLYSVSSLLEPIGNLMGLDGVILIGFILGLPANEIVIPVIIMAYISGNTIGSSLAISEMRNLFLANGWNITTAICFIIFTLCHWPCATTLMTIKKESASIKWTVLAAIIPTIVGFILCIIINSISRLL